MEKKKIQSPSLYEISAEELINTFILSNRQKQLKQLAKKLEKSYKVPIFVTKQSPEVGIYYPPGFPNPPYTKLHPLVPTISLSPYSPKEVLLHEVGHHVLTQNPQYSFLTRIVAFKKLLTLLSVLGGISIPVLYSAITKKPLKPKRGILTASVVGLPLLSYGFLNLLNTIDEGMASMVGYNIGRRLKLKQNIAPYQLGARTYLSDLAPWAIRLPKKLKNQEK